MKIWEIKQPIREEYTGLIAGELTGNPTLERLSIPTHRYQ